MTTKCSIRPDRQRGMTAIGWMIVIAIIGIFVLATLRLLPPFLQYFKIESVLDGVVVEFNESTTNKRAILQYLERRMDVEQINILTPDEVDIEREGRGFKVGVNYDHRTEFIGPVNFIMTFTKEVEVQP